MPKPSTEWKKPEPATVERFQASLPPDPLVERKKMFGYPASFVRGHFFAGLHNDEVVLRLPDGLKDRFAALAQAAVFDPMGTGRGMKDWWVVPRAVSGDAGRLGQLLADAFVEVAKLPPKESKRAKKAPARAAGEGSAAPRTRGAGGLAAKKGQAKSPAPKTPAKSARGKTSGRGR